MGDDLGLRRVQGGCIAAEAQLPGINPGDPAEAGNQMAAFDDDAVQVEVPEPGILAARRVAGGEAGGRTRIIAAFDIPEQRYARSGQRVRVFGGGFEQQ